jgi:hypothetical protein
MIDDPYQAEQLIPYSGSESEKRHIKQMLDKIEEAAKEKVSNWEYNKEQADEYATIKKTIKVDDGAKRNKYDWENMDLPGFSKHLTYKFFAERKTIKDQIIKDLMNGNKKGELIEYMEAVTNAINSVNDISKKLLEKPNDSLIMKAKTDAISQFIAATRVLEEHAKKAFQNHPLLIKWSISARISAFTYEFRNKCDIIKKFDLSNLTEQNVKFIKQTISEGQIFLDNYKNYLLKVKDQNIKMNYRVPAETIEKTINYLKSLIPNETIEKRNLPVVKASILDKISLFDGLIKIAQSILQKIEQNADPDQLANEILLKLLSNIDMEKIEQEIKV